MKRNSLFSFAILLACWMLFSLASCGGSEEMDALSGGLVSPEIALAVVDDFDSSSSSLTRVTPGSESIVTSVNMGGGNRLKATVYRGGSTVLDTRAQTRATTSALPEGTYFRLICYDGTVTVANYKGHSDYKMVKGKAVLQTTAIMVSAGNYKFVCYSYGETTAIEDGFDGTSLVLTNDMIKDKDLLYTVIDKALAINSSLLNINFKHLCSRIQVIFNPSSWGKLKTIEGEGKMKLTGTLPEITGMTLGEEGLTVLAKANHSWDFELPEKEVLVSKSAFKYVGVNADGHTLKLSIPKFTTQELDKDGNILVFSFPAQEIELSEMTFEAGNSYYCVFTVEGSSQIGAMPMEVVSSDGKSYFFACGNLIFYKTPPDGKQYIMAYEQGYYTGSKDAITGASGNSGEYMYFNWNRLDPSVTPVDGNVNSGGYSVATDPCQQLGKNWVTPSAALLTALSKLNNRGGLSYQLSTASPEGLTTVKGCYFGINTQPSVADQDRYLFFPASGLRNYTSTTVNGVGTYGGYWSSDVSGTNASSLNFSSSTAYMLTSSRSNGFAVRCSAEK